MNTPERRVPRMVTREDSMNVNTRTEAVRKQPATNEAEKLPAKTERK